MAGIVEAKVTLVIADSLIFYGKSSELYYFAYGSKMNRNKSMRVAPIPK